MKKLALTLVAFIVHCFVFQGAALARSGGLFISEIKLGGAIAGQPTEYVELFNDTHNLIDLNQYTLEYAKHTAALTEVQCLGDTWDTYDTTSNVRIFALTGSIEPRGRMVFQVSLNDGLHGSLRLINPAGTDGSASAVDMVGWGSTALCKEAEAATVPPNGTSIKRLFSTDGHPIDTENNKNDFSLPQAPLPESDIPPAKDDEVVAEAACGQDVALSEFLSDPDGLEADGGEFIELYNSSAREVSLLGCELKSSKSGSLRVFTAADTIPAGGYFVINVTDKLTNTSGSITFLSVHNEEVVNYTSLKEGETFAFIEGAWQVTDQATPGGVNALVLLSEEEVGGSGAGAVVMSPCPAGKYRNPETNRCRNIETAVAELAPCDEGEYRNPETNRCRQVALASATLTPCSAGEERNPATNRCRQIAATSSDLKPCEDGYERNPETNRCRKVASVMGASSSLAATDQVAGASKMDLRIIFVVLALAIAYGVYEYRADLRNLYDRIIGVLTKGRPPG